jgi:hypothetical protein
VSWDTGQQKREKLAGLAALLYLQSAQVANTSILTDFFFLGERVGEVVMEVFALRFCLYYTGEGDARLCGGDDFPHTLVYGVFS